MLLAFLNPILAAGALAMLTGTLGCFIVWRRMAYFGDGLAHSALLGAALGILIGIDNRLAMGLVGVAFIVGLIWLDSRRILASDTLLGILAHGGLAFGVLAMVALGIEDADLHDYLLGDISTLTFSALIGLYVGAAVVIPIIWKLWDGLILMVADTDLAAAEGVPTQRYNFILMLLTSITVALAVNMIGVLLVTSLLIIPPATARFFTNSPAQMATAASIIAFGGIVSGFIIAQIFELMSGPVIVALLLGGFVFTFIFAPRLNLSK